MKKFCVLVALIATLSCSRFAAAGGDDARPKPESRPIAELRVEVNGVGNVVQIGPDGKVEVKEFSGDIPREVLEKLPKEIQALLQKAPAQTGKRGNEGPKTSTRRCVLGKANVMVLKDGKLQEYDLDLSRLLSYGQLFLGTVPQKNDAKSLNDAPKAPSDTPKAVADLLPKEILDKLPKEVRDRLPKEIQEILHNVLTEARKQGSEGSKTPSQHSILGKTKVMVFRNGKVQEFDLDLSRLLADGQLLLGNVAQKNGTKLPDDVQKALVDILQSLGSKGLQAKTAAEKSDDIDAKLDKIVERLDRLENEVKAIKASHSK